MVENAWGQFGHRTLKLTNELKVESYFTEF